ncbi:MAG: right-handed parallel beta-helix repeat-containing protein [Caldilineaceae bacterium]|nr:right-handed parallel beta-helix repeat-containing protein [Caldilineaceae bacterium]MBP8106665.1 right-handed parallel beta-helix repeat-containing protein [Caldilineaceae bacterium]MBP8122195.1 right-handed parallel beta-helix repeat-containing protein [Caldilineaceae bacterium]MBP9071716.1 right-handed parallel beta-helix repeat-containing protein [Caldilineaceae bacterium]
MKLKPGVLVVWVVLAVFAAWWPGVLSGLGVTKEATATPSAGAVYDIGTPTVTDLWVDPVGGDDGRAGTSRTLALRTVSAAWAKVPQGAPLTGTGYRINLLPGSYAEATFPTYWEERHGTFHFPIILRAADGAGTVTLQGYVNLFDVAYLYLIDLEVANQGDVLHCERCDHFLIRNSRFDGGDRAAHETIKINQSQHVYIEGSEIRGSYENAIDFVAVQYGHIVGNRIHAADDWCIYLKGGSAYFRIESNEIYNCGTGGFTAGQGTGFEYMSSPWLHYEAYALRFINNVIHDTEGAGFGVNGGYDILFAHNTLYRVGARSHGMEFVFGGRGCDGEVANCQANHALGGWGPVSVGAEEPIPNRNIYVYNNLLYNPPGYASQWQHFAIHGPRTPTAGSHIPSPARTDDNLQIRGNLIWNGPADLDLGMGGDQGCQPANPTCNAAQLVADNAINTVDPQLIDPTGGNFRPVLEGNVAGVTTYALPDFPAWASLTPSVPADSLVNAAPVDRDGLPRSGPGLPGAYADPSGLRRVFLPILVR